MIPNCDPRDNFFYPTLTFVMDSYNALSLTISCPDENICMIFLLPFVVLMHTLFALSLALSCPGELP